MDSNLTKRLEQIINQYDEKECLIRIDNTSNPGPGYHTKLTGIVHPTLVSADSCSVLLFANNEDYTILAKNILKRLIKLQDTDPISPTFGLWAYYMEESLPKMLAPDYNWADFIGKHLIYILKEHSEKLGEQLRLELTNTLKNAVKCSIKRDVLPDYTNISLMSSYIIIAAGELVGDKNIFAIGKKKLITFLEYTRATNGFTEYNSSGYTLVDIEEITRMMMYFSDKECKEIAEELNVWAWSDLCKHYHTKLKQLSAPQSRCYRELDNNVVEQFIYLGTQGKFGSLTDNPVNVAHLMLKLNCPEVCREFLKEENVYRFIEEIYCKQNDFETYLKMPDLKSFTYMTPEISMGAFEKTDLWNQRRSAMLFWKNDGKPCYMRLKCMKNNYDFSSGMAITSQYKNIILTNLGFANNRGDYHISLDPIKGGKIIADKLFFRFEIGGNIANTNVKCNSNTFEIYDDGINIKLNIQSAVFDGQEMQITTSEDDNKKYIDLICINAKDTQVDFNVLNETYCIISIIVNDDNLFEIHSEMKDEFITSSLLGSNTVLTVKSPITPVSYYDYMWNSCSNIDNV